MLKPFKMLGRIAYGLFVWIVFLVLSLLTLVLVIVVPPLKVRRAIARHASRAFLTLAGMPLKVTGAHLLPRHPCVVVANHSSYLDGLILKAALPAHFSFVIKKEMDRVPLAGALLRRIGSEFVDRFNRHSGGMDARRLLRAASGGQSLAFFPEGTFNDTVGVGRFHIGAFVVAARASLPVVPVVIRGARRGLPAGSPWPRPGTIEVEVLEVLALTGRDDTGALATELRDAARSRILASLDEPDLEVPATPPPVAH